jgi:hypothetical protein
MLILHLRNFHAEALLPDNRAAMDIVSQFAISPGTKERKSSNQNREKFPGQESQKTCFRVPKMREWDPNFSRSIS